MIDMREDLTYGTDIEANKRKLEELMSICKVLIEHTKAIIAA